MHITKALRTCLAIILLGWSGLVSAATISNYVFDFNDQDAVGQIDEAKSTRFYQYLVYDFAPQGWGHIVDGIFDPSDGTTSYPAYSFEATAGVDNTGALSVAEQSGWSTVLQDTQKEHDLLVTPLVSGTATLDVKMRSTEGWYDHHITFYKVSYVDGQYVRGEELAPDNAISTSSDNWQTATFTLAEPTYIGIEASYALIDNFTATTAEIAERPALTILHVTDKTTSYDADTNNNVNLDYSVELKNIGTVKLVANETENYSVSITKGQNGEVLATIPVDSDLDVGATTTLDVSASIPYAELGADVFTAYIQENITKKNREAAVVQAVPYAPLMSLNIDDKYTAPGSNVEFGLSKNDVTRSFSISNKGGKDLKVNTFSLPDGFTTNLELPVTIAPHTSKKFPVVLSKENIGVHSGLLTISADDLPDYTVNLSGTIVDSTAWLVDFEDLNRWRPNEYPKGFVVETPEGQASPDWGIYNIESSLGLVDNKLAIQNASDTRLTKFISPLLSFDGSETLSFDAAKREQSFSAPTNSSVLKVYYSSDRKNWNLLYTITADEAAAHDAVFSNVGYAGNGWYSENAFEFTKYTVENIPAGKWYVGFEAGYAQVDNILGGHVVDVAHDIAFNLGSSNTDGQVNHAFNTSIDVSNNNTKDEAENSYTAKLFFDNDEVATATAPALESGTTTGLNFSFTPHRQGSFNAYVQLQFNDTTITSDTVLVTINAETYSPLKQVGDANGVTSAPIYTYDKNSEGAAILPAEAIGLPAGTKITSLTLRGSADRDINISSLKAYLGATDIDAISLDNDFTLTSVADTANMTRIYDGSYQVKGGGSGNYSGISDPIDIIKIDLAEPFVYNGGNLVLAMTHNAGYYCNIYLLGDKTNYPENSVKRSNDNDVSSGTWGLFPMPVVYFNYGGEAPVVSGVVTSNGTPVADVPVVLSSGDIVYSDTTDADGHYSFTVLQDKDFQLTANINGYEPYAKDNVKISGNTTFDITLSPATGLYIKNRDIPTKGEVNTKLTATAEVLNDIKTDIAAEDYTAKLYVNGEAVAEAQPVALAPEAGASFNFEYVPHTAGTFPAYIKFAYGEHVYTTDTTQIAIAEESFGGFVQVGDPTGTNSGSEQAPWNNYYKKFEGEIIYTADQLNISKGSVITHIAFRGSFGTSSRGTENLKVYIENTADGAYDSNTAFTPRDTTQMTKVYDAAIEYGNHPTDEVYDVLSFDIPGGFAYTGQSIRISSAGFHNSNDADNKITWVIDTQYNNQVKGRSTDYGAISDQSWRDVNGLPVMYLTTVAKKAVKGTVVDEETKAPVANATVTLQSGGIEYKGTTDAEGYYTIRVAKGDLTYNAIFAAEGYVTDTVPGIAFADEDTLVVNEALRAVRVEINVNGTVKGITSGVEPNAAPINAASVVARDAEGNTVASTTTSADGTYSISGLDQHAAYTIEFSAAGFVSQTIDVTTGDANQTVDATLWTETALGINGVNAADKVLKGNVYTIDGKFVGRNIDVSTLRSGLYIIHGKKFVVR